MEDPLKIPGPPPPRRLVGPGWTPLRSAPGLGLGRAVAVALPGRRAGGQEGSPQAEAGGRAGRRRQRCSSSPLGLRLRGLPGAGLSLGSA